MLALLYNDIQTVLHWCWSTSSYEEDMNGAMFPVRMTFRLHWELAMLVDGENLGPCKLPDAICSVKPAIPTVLDASMGKVDRITVSGRVNLNSSSINPARNLARALDILAIYGCRKAVLGVVSEVKGFLVVFEPLDGDYGPE